MVSTAAHAVRGNYHAGKENKLKPATLLTVLSFTMLKSFLSTSGVLATSASAAIAGPYANVEANSGWVGTENVGTSTEFHLGYEGANGVYSWYGQAGPAILSPNGGGSEVELSGKVGGAVQASEKFSVYAELSGITGNIDNAYNGKLGAKYVF